MAELIQKKLQGEVEKYQQLQKGKGAGSVYLRPKPFTHSKPRAIPRSCFLPYLGTRVQHSHLSILPHALTCRLHPCLLPLLHFLLSRIVGRVARLMSLIESFLPPTLPSKTRLE